MEFNQKKTPVEIIKKSYCEEYILKTFILVLMENGTKICGKNLMN